MQCPPFTQSKKGKTKETPQALYSFVYNDDATTSGQCCYKIDLIKGKILKGGIYSKRRTTIVDKDKIDMILKITKTELNKNKERYAIFIAAIKKLK